LVARREGHTQKLGQPVSPRVEQLGQDLGRDAPELGRHPARIEQRPGRGPTRLDRVARGVDEGARQRLERARQGQHQRPLEALAHVVGEGLEHRPEELVACGEHPVDERPRHPRALGERRHVQRLEAALVQDAGRVRDELAPAQLGRRARRAVALA
jgi:hypothetical protein